MAFFGAGAKIAQGVARSNELNKLIENHQHIEKSTVLDHYSNEQRFLYANEIADAYCQAGPENFERKIECLDKLQQEYKMIEETTELEAPVTKAQIYALALAIKELSVGLEGDKAKLDQQLDQSAQKHNNQLNEIKEIYTEQINTITKSLKSTVETTLTRFDSESQRLIEQVQNTHTEVMATISEYKTEVESEVMKLDTKWTLQYQQLDLNMTQFISQIREQIISSQTKMNLDIAQLQQKIIHNHNDLNEYVKENMVFMEQNVNSLQISLEEQIKVIFKKLFILFAVGFFILLALIFGLRFL